MKLIPLKGKYGEGKFLKVSDEDFGFVNSLKIHVSDKGYAKTYYRGKHVSIHTLLIGGRADLSGANLYEAKNGDLVKAQTVIVPEGDIIGWKKCLDNVIVKLLIPKEAKRSNATGRKCRAEYVEVLDLIYGNDKRKKVEKAISSHDKKTEYKKGETVKCDKWDEERFNECSGGIHFFITREEAEDYNI